MCVKLPRKAINILCSLEKLKHVFPTHTHTHNQNTTYKGLVVGVNAHACGECVCVMSVCVVYVYVSRVHDAIMHSWRACMMCCMCMCVCVRVCACDKLSLAQPNCHPLIDWTKLPLCLSPSQVAVLAVLPPSPCGQPDPSGQVPVLRRGRRGEDGR